MLGITTLELSAILVVVVGAAAGIAVSVVARRQKSLRSDRVSMQVKSEATDSEDSFLDFDSDPAPAVELHEESGEPTTAPAAVVSAPAVSSFQASMPEPQQIQTTTFGSDQIATEPPTPQEGTAVSGTQASISNRENQVSPIPIVDESPVVTSVTKEEEAHVSHSEPIAMPTDSAAIENITPAPAFPVAPQSASLGGIASSSAPRASVSAPSAYCVKCKSKKLMKDPTSVTMKNGRPAVSGFCCDCGTRVFRIGKLSTF